jgi:hypothetical protein
MSNPSYNSTKVAQFLNAKQAYYNAKNNYMTALTTFNTQLNTLTESHKAAKTSSKFEFNPEYKDAGGGQTTFNEFLTKEGVVIYKDGYALSDASKNVLNNANQYVSDLQMSDVSYSGKVSNTVVQMGLNDLAFNEDGGLREVYQIPTSSTPVIDNSPSGGSSMPPKTCDINFLYACDSNAKLNNMPYYGIADKDGNSCQCYTFTDSNKPSTVVTPTITTATIDTINGNDVSTGISYLGFLFDGSLYALKQQNYSDNFSDLYNVDSSNMIELNNENKITTCNPFTGSGVNKITFNSLGETICEAS